MTSCFYLAGKENQDESLFTGGSSKSDNSDENAYSDCKLLLVNCVCSMVLQDFSAHFQPKPLN